MHFPSRSMKPFLVTWAAYLIGMELVAGLVLPATKVFPKADFRCFYAAGVLARTAPTQLYNLVRQMDIQISLVGPQNGWTMFINPPYEALLLVPFSLLSYRTAYLLFLAFNMALIVPCFLLARDAFSNVLDPWQPRPGLMFFLFLPLSVAVMQGQGSIRLLLFCCAAWHELKRGKDFNAGLLVALALFKMQVTVPLAVLLIAWRGRKVLAGLATGTMIAGAVSLWLVGMRGMQAFGQLLVMNSLVKDEARSAQLATSQFPAAMPNLRGLLYGCGGRYLPHLWLLGITLTLSAAVFLWVVSLARKERDEATAFALVVIAALLLSYHLNYHDLTLLLLPLGLLAVKGLPYFPALASACFILSVLVAQFGLQTHCLMAIPLLGLILTIARGPRVEVITASQFEPAMR